MIIDADVATAAAHWGLPVQLLQAVVIAEGNIVKAVQCSIPSIETRPEALDVLCRSCVHAMSDFIHSNGNDAELFVSFWGARWAPENVANDPTHLNQNWVSNVEKLWGV